MSYTQIIEEIADAADKLAGDGYGPEARSVAIQSATSIWFACEQERRIQENLAASRQFFGTTTTPHG